MISEDKVKSINKYVDLLSKSMGIDIQFKQIDGDDFIIYVVDYGKYDKNSPNFDQEYYDKIFYKKRGIFPMSNQKVINFTNQLKKILGISDRINSGFEFKNYDHLKKLVDDIEREIKNTKYPDTKIELGSDFNSPRLMIDFIGKFKNQEDFKEFFDYIQSNTDFDLDNYRWTASIG